MRRLLLAALGIAAVAWAGFRAGDQLRPAVWSVPVVEPGGELVVEGRGFGMRQAGGHLVLGAGERSGVLREDLDWSPGHIASAWPALLAEAGVSDHTIPTLSVVADRGIPWVELRSDPVPFAVRAPDLPSPPFGYEVPVEPDAPWPLARRDHRNTGRSPLPAQYAGDEPWSFFTGRSILAAPLLGADGTVYVGSADGVVYAIRPDGTERWRFPTGGVVDAAAALLRDDPRRGATLVVPAGDGRLYRLRRGDDPDTLRERLVWSFDARLAGGGSGDDGFGGGVAVGPDGTLYAGNRNFRYYALTSDGGLRWAHATGAEATSTPAIGDDGTLYAGSLDTRVHAVRPDGSPRWSTRTLGMVAASPAVGSDGTVYVGSFDGSLYALDGRSGEVRWSHRTGDAIRASPTLGADERGRTVAVYVGSTDGMVYALSPGGELRWRYDTGAPVRSSAALGAGPEGDPAASRGILYVGSADGRLYALHAVDGTRRWSFDTTGDDPELADRNDLNGPVALGPTGAYVGAESGRLWYVPYDWCVRGDDPRCRTDPGEDRPRDATRLVYVTPGGSARPEGPETLPPATVITLELEVRRDGETLDARLCNTPLWCDEDALRVMVEPHFAFDVEKSPGGRYLHVVPRGVLDPDAEYAVRVEADWHTGGLRFGSLSLAGRRGGRVIETVRFRTAPERPPDPPLEPGPDRVAAFAWTRPTVPVPSLPASLDPLALDALDWLVGVVALGEPAPDGSRPVLLWATGAQRDPAGRRVPDPGSEFLLPLSGTVRGDAFAVRGRDLRVRVAGMSIPVERLDLRGVLGPGLAVRPGASLYAETPVLSIPTHGPWLVLAGLANDLWRKLVVTGTYATRPYAGPAARRPPGVVVEPVDYEPPEGGDPGRATAEIVYQAHARYPVGIHRPAILLLDGRTLEPVPLDYASLVTSAADADGDLVQVSLRIPPDAQLPDALEALVLLDLFPARRDRL